MCTDFSISFVECSSFGLWRITPTLGPLLLPQLMIQTLTLQKLLVRTKFRNTASTKDRNPVAVFDGSEAMRHHQKGSRLLLLQCIQSFLDDSLTFVIQRRSGLKVTGTRTSRYNVRTHHSEIVVVGLVSSQPTSSSTLKGKKERHRQYYETTAFNSVC